MSVEAMQPNVRLRSVGNFLVCLESSLMWSDLNWYLAVPPLSEEQQMWGMQLQGGWGSFSWREVQGGWT